MESLNWHPEKGEAMPFRFAALFIVYLAYALSSGFVAKHGSGLDPLGLTSPGMGLTVTAPPVNPDQGSGWDPNG